MSSQTALASSILAIALASSGCGGTDSFATRPSRPAPTHVLLIVVDTLRADHLGCYGHERDTSPNIDRLAAGATRFERAFATSPWTMPSIASILTGLHPSTLGIDGPDHRLPPEVTTIAEMFAEHARPTAGVVSNALLREKLGFHQGFDHYAQDYATDGERLSSRGVTNLAIERLREFREQPGGSPFFLFVHYFDPHYGYRRHRGVDFAPPSAGRLTGQEDWGQLSVMSSELTDEELDFVRRLYDEEIRHTDRHIGRLLAALEEHGFAKDTTVILTADHGEGFLAHGWLGHTKTLYNELVRVPLVIRTPSDRGGRIVETPVGLAALSPTILDFADVPYDPARFQARSLADAIWERGPFEVDSVVTEVDFTALFEQMQSKNSHKRALIGVRFKLIRDEETGTEELYDILADPDEQMDIAALRPDLVASMGRALDERIATFERASRRMRAPGTRLSAEEIELLRGLGYVE